MDEPKPNQTEKVKIPTDDLERHIDKSITDADAADFIFKAVDFYVRYLQKQRNQGAR